MELSDVESRHLLIGSDAECNPGLFLTINDFERTTNPEQIIDFLSRDKEIMETFKELGVEPTKPS